MKPKSTGPIAAALLASLALAGALPAAASSGPQSVVRPGNPRETNISVATDPRLIAASAALVLAGYAGPAGSPAPAARERAVALLAGVGPELREKLQNYYRAHRDASLAADADAARFRAVAVLLTPPPSLSLGVPDNQIPADLKPLTGFSSLVGELFRTGAFRAALPELTAMFDEANGRVTRQVGPVVTSTLEYLHTVPVRSIETAAIRSAEGKIVRPAVSRERSLKVFADPLLDQRTAVIRVDLVDAAESHGFQKPGDRYTVLAGSSVSGSEAAVRVALLRFVFAPIVERNLEPISERRLELDQLVAASPAALARYGEERFAMIEDSLVSAANARLRVREKSLGPNSAVVALAEAQERGELLAIHFYEQFEKTENVGLDFAAIFPQFVSSLDPGREKRRAEQIAAARAAAPAERAAATAADDLFAKRIIEADELITKKRFADARPLLEAILAAEPGNARALFGLAQVLENTPDETERDAAAADEDRAGAQSERLERAVNLYRRAAERAGDRERWIASWSHVYAGRILDFLDLREQAVSEYEAAVKIGEVPQGAFREARAGVAAPYAPPGAQ